MDHDMVDLEKKVFVALANSSDLDLESIGITTNDKQMIKRLLDSGVDMPRLSEVITKIELDTEELKKLIN